MHLSPGTSILVTLLLPILVIYPKLIIYTRIAIIDSYLELITMRKDIETRTVLLSNQVEALKAYPYFDHKTKKWAQLLRVYATLLNEKEHHLTRWNAYDVLVDLVKYYGKNKDYKAYVDAIARRESASTHYCEPIKTVAQYNIRLQEVADTSFVLSKIKPKGWKTQVEALDAERVALHAGYSTLQKGRGLAESDEFGAITYKDGTKGEAFSMSIAGEAMDEYLALFKPITDIQADQMIGWFNNVYNQQDFKAIRAYVDPSFKIMHLCLPRYKNEPIAHWIGRYKLQAVIQLGKCFKAHQLDPTFNGRSQDGTLMTYRELNQFRRKYIKAKSGLADRERMKLRAANKDTCTMACGTFRNSTPDISDALDDQINPEEEEVETTYTLLGEGEAFEAKNSGLYPYSEARKEDHRY